jgi:hypothetical protein
MSEFNRLEENQKLEFGDFCAYADIDDGRGWISFCQLPNHVIAVIASLQIPYSTETEPVNAIMPYEEYLEFFNTITTETPASVIRAKLKSYLVSQKEL